MNQAFDAAPEGRSGRGFRALRRLAAQPPARERCGLCASQIDDHQHPHLVDPQDHRLLCVCGACAILFDAAGVTRYRRVPQDVRELGGLEITDVFWNGLAIPIGLVFVFRSSVSGKVEALYPSPAGPTQSSIDEDTWLELAALDPLLQTIRPDIEALLVNRIKGAREYYLAPIDECYKLVGLIRQYWRGFSGGDEAWQRIRSFLDDLKLRSRSAGVAHRA